MTSSLRWEWSLAGLLAGSMLVVGCHGYKRVDPASIANCRIGPLRVAVAPAINLSGSSDFDPNHFADLMASELGYTEGISVIPVSRVLGVLSAQGLEQVESPEHALEIAEMLGANAILVFAVTEYDPYDPPSIGITAQLYGKRPRAGGGDLDPIALSRQTRLAGSTRGSNAKRLLAQTERVFDADHQSVVREVQAFASRRGADESPYGWRKYLVSQQHYIRFCCYATIRALFEGDIESEVAGSRNNR